nr:fimbria/pilus outer membrane usher protein [Vibrio hippocampi]
MHHNLLRCSVCLLCLNFVVYNDANATDDVFAFNTDFLHGVNSNPKVFRSQSGIVEGRYQTLVSFNGRQIGRKVLEITAEEEARDSLCLAVGLLDSVSVNFNQEFYDLALTDNACLDLTKIEFADLKFDLSKPSLDIAIPQKYIKANDARIDAADGINGIKAGYNVSASTGTNVDESMFSSVNAQINLWGWQAHTDIASNWSSGQSFESNVSNLYLTKALPQIRSNLVIGKGNANGRFVEGFSFGGIGLTSSRLMSNARSSYLPDISGIANSTSKVTVRQNERVVYSEVISSGPYKIDGFDVFGSGDLRVEIEDANGNIEEKVYPLISVSSLLRENYSDFSLAVGKRHLSGKIEGMFDSDRNFIFADGRYGYQNYTLGAGLILDDDYQNLGIGGSFYLGRAGSLSLKGGMSIANYDDGSRLTGMTANVEYGYQLLEDTHLQLAAYRYRDSDYVPYSSFYPENYSDTRQRQKHRLQLLMSSRFQGANISFSGWQQTYWNNDDISTGGSLSLSKSWWRGLGSSLSVSYSNQNGTSDTSYGLSLSLPLNYGDQYHTVTTSASIGSNSDLALSASSGGNISDKVGYSVSVGDYGVNTSLSYRHNKASLSSRINYQDGESLLSVGASGAVVWTQPSGLLASNNRSGTVALVSTQGIEGIKVRGAESDANGYALVNVSPYQNNALRVDVNTVPVWAEVDTSVQNVTPVEGAIVHQIINSSKVYSYTLSVKDKDGISLKTGELESSGLYLGAIAPNGMATISSVNPIERLSINSDSHECEIYMHDVQANKKIISEVICE